MVGLSGIAIRHLFSGIIKGGLAVGVMTTGLTQAQTPEPGIYTCTDARGRKLTSDRPIAECNDREQKVLNPSGTVKGKVGPALTAIERAELEVREKAALEERARFSEEKRRDRALLVRYPNQQVHDKERAEAVNQVGLVRQAASNRVEELMRQRATINLEMEFYKKDLSKAPAALRRQLDESTQNIAIQDRFIADQDTELRRVNTRFDDELTRLKQLWAIHSPAKPAVPDRVR